MNKAGIMDMEKRKKEMFSGVAQVIKSTFTYKANSVKKNF
jgi:hypothetical protein